jgi:hypothetical protein
VAAVVFIGMDIVAAGLLYPGYDYTSQQVSELSAIGAPSRGFWMALTIEEMQTPRARQGARVEHSAVMSRHGRVEDALAMVL